MKIFRFLADILSESEFDSLSYYHVSRFITCILNMCNGVATVNISNVNESRLNTSTIEEDP